MYVAVRQDTVPGGRGDGEADGRSVAEGVRAAEGVAVADGKAARVTFPARSATVSAEKVDGARKSASNTKEDTVTPP